MSQDASTSTWLDRLDVRTDALRNAYRVVTKTRRGQFGLYGLSVVLFLAVFGPLLAPYPPLQAQVRPNGALVSLAGPSLAYPLGTTASGYDVLSQVLVGARTVFVVGVITGVVSVGIGTTVGIVAGYFGGYVDDVLMRITDIAYGIPLLPFLVVALTILGRSIFAITLLIGLLYWRNSARVIRSSVLSLRDEEFIQKAKTVGASERRILYKQVLPNVLPLSLLYFAFAMGIGVLFASSIAFLGFGDPSRISWGRMIFVAWTRAGTFKQPLWVIAPGAMLSVLIASVYFVGQTYEEVANPELGDH